MDDKNYYNKMDCPTCGAKFKNESSYYDHRNRHINFRPYKCTYCDAKFFQPGTRTTHIRAKHTFEKPFKCTKCNKCFCQSGALYNHLNSCR